jgi:hypothetical protein
MPTEFFNRLLEAEKTSYTDLMQQAEPETISFERARQEGGIHRKRDLQTALFPEGLTWWIEGRVFETGKSLLIDDLGLVIWLASPTGFEPVRLQNGPLIPKYLGHASH